MKPETLGRSTSLRISPWYPWTTHAFAGLPSVKCLERYWTPELLAALQRNFSRSSKSPAVPPFQMRKVLPFAGFCAVVSPRMTPSFTDQSRGSPSQPARSLPLNRLTEHSASGAGSAALNETAAAMSKARIIEPRRHEEHEAGLDVRRPIVEQRTIVLVFI